MTAPHILTLDDLVKRLGWDRHQIMRMVRADPPQFPAPMNVEQTRNYRWHEHVVEAYELTGECRPPAGLRAVS